MRFRIFISKPVAWIINHLSLRQQTWTTNNPSDSSLAQKWVELSENSKLIGPLKAISSRVLHVFIWPFTIQNEIFKKDPVRILQIHWFIVSIHCSGLVVFLDLWKWDQTGTFRRCAVRDDVPPPKSISALSSPPDVRAILSRCMGQMRERCVLPTIPPHPAPNAEVNYGGVSSQRRRTERERERELVHVQARVGSKPPTYTAPNLTHTKASSSQLYAIIQSHPTLSHSLNAHKTGCCCVGI